MRQVRFPLGDRVALIPVELVLSAKYVLLLAAAFLVLGGLGADGYSLARAAGAGLSSAGLFLAASAGSIVLAPALLPWLPGRALSLKGFWVGLLLLAGLLAPVGLRSALLEDWPSTIAWCLLVPAVASFLAMNFTGATTYTSLSGVRREMRVAVPVQATAGLLGAVLWLVGRFV